MAAWLNFASAVESRRSIRLPPGSDSGSNNKSQPHTHAYLTSTIYTYALADQATLTTVIINHMHV